MSSPINTAPIQQFIQSVKSADRTNQREVRLDLKDAKLLAFALGELLAKQTEDYDKLLSKLLQATGQVNTVQMDGGGFG